MPVILHHASGASLREHVACPVCHEDLRFSSHTLTGATVQSCACGSRPLPLTRPAPTPAKPARQHPRTARACKWCGTVTPVRSDQRFCGESCGGAYAASMRHARGGRRTRGLPSLDVRRAGMDK